jgi:hypothetical protein
VYPHRIRVLRPKMEGGFGAQGYAGMRESNEEQIAVNLPAAIQARGSGKGNEAELPGDAPTTTWLILIPAYALARNTVRMRDIIVDETGVRYQVTNPYNTVFGHNLRARRLEL